MADDGFDQTAGPSKRRKVAAGKSALLCVCKTPNDPNKMMIECDACNEWYHPVCVGRSQTDDFSSWFCADCLCLLQEEPALSKYG